MGWRVAGCGRHRGHRRSCQRCVMRNGVRSAPHSRWASSPGPIGPNPSRMAGFRSRSSVRRASCSAIASSVSASTVTLMCGRMPLSAGSPCSNTLVQISSRASIRRCDGDRSSFASRGTDRFLRIVFSFAPVSMSRNPVRCQPSVVFAKRRSRLSMPFSHARSRSSGWATSRTCRTFAWNSLGESVLRDLQQRLLDQLGLADADVPERIGEGIDMVEGDLTRPGGLTNDGKVTERSPRPAPSDGSRSRPGAARVAPT